LADGLPAGDVYLRRAGISKWTFPANVETLPATGPGAWVARRLPGVPYSFKDSSGVRHNVTHLENGDILLSPSAPRKSDKD